MTQTFSPCHATVCEIQSGRWLGGAPDKTNWVGTLDGTYARPRPLSICAESQALFQKRQADEEILRQVRLSLLKNFFCNKTVTLGLMFECMWCKTIMSHPSCSTLFPYHSTRFFAFLAQSQDSTMPGRVPQINFSLFSPRNGRKMSKGVRLV